MIWQERKGSVLALVAVFMIVSATPFFQSGTRGLLINELIKITGGASSSSILILVGMLIVVTMIPAVLYVFQGYLMKIFWFFFEEKFETLVLRKRG